MSFKRVVFSCLLLFLTTCNCATVSRLEEYGTQKMMDSTVHLYVEIVVKLIDKAGNDISPEPLTWAGSGVIYDKVGGITNKRHTMILTANHVLETPEVGYSEELSIGTITVDSVKIIATSFDGKQCEVFPRIYGINDHRDVAIGEAICNMGTVAPIATSVPEPGAAVIITGHPLGILNTIVTHGVFSGWADEYMIGSAPIAPGNSGGPVWYNGEVIGLAVRGIDEYKEISVIAPLEQIIERISELETNSSF